MQNFIIKCKKIILLSACALVCILHTFVAFAAQTTAQNNIDKKPKKIVASAEKSTKKKSSTRSNVRVIAKSQRNSKVKLTKKDTSKRKQRVALKKQKKNVLIVKKNQPKNSANKISVNKKPPLTLVNFVRETVNNLRYSAYKLGGTRFDPARGIYIVDCSSYVDRILQTVHPQAFSKLVTWSGSGKPTTHDYYQFFNNLTDDPQHYWDTVNDVGKLRPGDILVFRYKNEFDAARKGHIVIVMDKPIRNKDTFMVRISDAAPVRHSQDTRLPRVSGIGIGTMLLKVNTKTFRPFAYAWGINSRWERNVTFAMARPLEFRA